MERSSRRPGVSSQLSALSCGDWAQRQFCERQRSQGPPQSTPVSPPFWMPSSQLVRVQIPARQIALWQSVWRVQLGRVKLFLLDTKLLYDAPFGPPLGAFAAGSPWVGDLDGDGCLDLAFAHTARTDTTMAAVVSRYKIPTAVPEHVSWPGYLGPNGDSTFHGWRP